VPFTKERDLWWNEEMAKEDIKPSCEPEVMDAEDVLLSFTPVEARANRRGHSHHSRISPLVQQTLKWSLTSRRKIFSFVPQTSGGSPVTAMSSTARWPSWDFSHV